MQKKIAFIICVNDEVYFSECLFYIGRLHVPEGYEIEIYPLRGAKSIYEAYQQAMEQSDAEYKIYMHQDVFLVCPDMLKYLQQMFERHPRAGIAGVIGAGSISQDRKFFRSWDLGNVMGCSEKKAFHNELYKEESKAVILDGMFLMTRMDVDWRKDVLSGWDFYDISQSLEYWNRGYEIWIPAQHEPWCIHDCGYLNLTRYDEAQEEFLKVYGWELPDYSGQPLVYPSDFQGRFTIMMELKEQWKKLIFLGQIQEVWEMMQKFADERFIDTETVILRNILEILQEESRENLSADQGFLYDCGSFTQAYQKYMQVKFWLRRKKYAKDQTGNCPHVSEAAKKLIGFHTMLGH